MKNLHLHEQRILRQADRLQRMGFPITADFFRNDPSLPRNQPFLVRRPMQVGIYRGDRG